MKNVHLPKEFKCDQCDYETTQNHLLKAHKMQAHTMERPYKCDQCDYAGATSGLLSTHKDCFQLSWGASSHGSKSVVKSRYLDLLFENI